MALSDDERAGLYLEAWKQTITVQQHFNDIEWRIRGLALTAATFAIGAAAVAANNGQVWVSVLILAIGVVLWYAFYFVDRYWYHPLLIGAVKHGEKIEGLLDPILPEVSLTKMISEASPVKRPFPIRVLSFGFVPPVVPGDQRTKRSASKLHSSAKLWWFYSIGGFALVVSAFALGAFSLLSEESAPTPVVVKIDEMEPVETVPSVPSALPSPAPHPGSPTTQ